MTDPMTDGHWLKAQDARVDEAERLLREARQVLRSVSVRIGAFDKHLRESAGETADRISEFLPR